MFYNFQAFLERCAAIQGYGAHEAGRLLNPFFWVRYWFRCVCWEIQKVHRHCFGHHCVVVKDANESGDTIAVVRRLWSEEYIVECEICAIMQITYKTTSVHQARRVYDTLRDEVWYLATQFRCSAQGADELDVFLKSLDDLASRYQR